VFILAKSSFSFAIKCVTFHHFLLDSSKGRMLWSMTSPLFFAQLFCSFLVVSNTSMVFLFQYLKGDLFLLLVKFDAKAVLLFNSLDFNF